MPLQPPHPLTRTPAPVQVQEQQVEEEGCRRAEPTQDRQNSRQEGNIIVDDNESGLPDPVQWTQGPESRIGTSLQHSQVKAKNPPKPNPAKPEPDGSWPYSLHLGGAILKTLCSVDSILSSSKPLREAAKGQEAKT